jgi:hypothetical protein
VRWALASCRRRTPFFAALFKCCKRKILRKKLGHWLEALKKYTRRALYFFNPFNFRKTKRA